MNTKKAEAPVQSRKVLEDLPQMAYFAIQVSLKQLEGLGASAGHEKRKRLVSSDRLKAKHAGNPDFRSGLP